MPSFEGTNSHKDLHHWDTITIEACCFTFRNEKLDTSKDHYDILSLLNGTDNRRLFSATEDAPPPSRSLLFDVEDNSVSSHTMVLWLNSIHHDNVLMVLWLNFPKDLNHLVGKSRLVATICAFMAAYTSSVSPSSSSRVYGPSTTSTGLKMLIFLALRTIDFNMYTASVGGEGYRILKQSEEAYIAYVNCFAIVPTCEALSFHILFNVLSLWM